MVRPSESPPVVREILNLLPNDLWFLPPLNLSVKAGKASAPAAARPDELLDLG
jgi:hypothetical protein